MVGFGLFWAGDIALFVISLIGYFHVNYRDVPQYLKNSIAVSYIMVMICEILAAIVFIVFIFFVMPHRKKQYDKKYSIAFLVLAFVIGISAFSLIFIFMNDGSLYGYSLASILFAVTVSCALIIAACALQLSRKTPYISQSEISPQNTDKI